MKKLICFLMLVFASVTSLSLSSCGGDDESNSNPTPVPEPQYSIVGAWEKDNYFISFSSDGYYCAYLGDNFIDSGTYTYYQDTKKIICSNPYFTKTTTYDITSLNSTDLGISSTVKSLEGKNYYVDRSKKITFKKTQNYPTSKNHKLVGKSFEAYSSTMGTVTRRFSTHNTGLKTATKGSAAKYPATIYYVYYNNKVYMQYFYNSSEAVPSIGGWSLNDGDIYAYKLVFGTTGQIDDWDTLEL